VALSAYGATFVATNSAKPRAARKELLAGFLWIHANLDDVASALLRAPIALQLLLAKAFKLDHQALQIAAAWSKTVARRVLALMTPGLTPVKRKRPDCAASGQIVKPGLPLPAGDGGSAGASQPGSRKPRAARALQPSAAAAGSSLDGSASDSDTATSVDAAAASAARAAQDGFDTMPNYSRATPSPS
jgi:hypothetical protein